MAKRKSNRAARRLLAWGKCHTSFRITNTRVMYHGGNMHFICPYVLRTKPSSAQQRAKRRVEEARIEWNFRRNCSDGMSADQAWDLAVKTVKG